MNVFQEFKAIRKAVEFFHVHESNFQNCFGSHDRHKIGLEFFNSPVITESLMRLRDTNTSPTVT